MLSGVKFPIGKRSTLIAGAILLLVLAIWFGQRKLVESDFESELSQAFRSGMSGHEEDPATATRTRSKRRVSELVANKTHEVSDLNDFYHPAIQLEGVSLEEALNRLLQTYRKICEETGETILPLRWEVNGDPKVIPKLVLEGRFLRSCKLLAMYARMTCEVRDGVLVFSEIETGPERTQKWTVPPTFATYLSGLLEKESALREPNPFGDKAVPEALTDLPLVGELFQSTRPFDLSETLKNLGILVEGESVTMNQSNSHLEVDASEGTIGLIDSLVQMSIGETPVQIRYDVSHEVNGEIQSLPKIVALPGQNATIEMGKEFSGMQKGKIVNAFAGVKVSLEAELYGFGERTSVLYERTDPPSDAEIAAYQKSGRLEDLDLEGVGIMSPHVTKTLQDRRENLPLEVWSEADSSGGKVYLTSQRIDATGRAIEGP